MGEHNCFIHPHWDTKTQSCHLLNMVLRTNKPGILLWIYAATREHINWHQSSVPTSVQKEDWTTETAELNLRKNISKSFSLSSRASARSFNGSSWIIAACFTTKNLRFSLSLLKKMYHAQWWTVQSWSVISSVLHRHCVFGCKPTETQYSVFLPIKELYILKMLLF